MENRFHQLQKMFLFDDMNLNTAVKIAASLELNAKLSFD